MAWHDLALLGCSLVSLHFQCDILATITVHTHTHRLGCTIQPNIVEPLILVDKVYNCYFSIFGPGNPETRVFGQGWRTTTRATGVGEFRPVTQKRSDLALLVVAIDRSVDGWCGTQERGQSVSQTQRRKGGGGEGTTKHRKGGDFTSDENRRGEPLW